MRCKPGELAVVVAEDMGCEANIGAVVRVLADQETERPDWIQSGEWMVVCEGRPLACIDVDDGAVYEVPAGEWLTAWDHHLVPIRDPGEDAVDEMVRRVPPPLPEITPAMLDREVEHG